MSSWDKFFAIARPLGQLAWHLAELGAFIYLVNEIQDLKELIKSKK